MPKRIIKIVIILSVIVALLYLVLGVFKIPKRILMKIYPQKYSEYVEKYSEENNLDPLLVYAIIKAESNFRPDVVSKSNATGLMQLMEKTAEDTAKKMGMTYEKDILKDPEQNIKIGTKYFSTLYAKYKNISLALSAYNAGSGNVDKWINENTVNIIENSVDTVPFKETNSYVKKILNDYEIYKKLYK